MGWCDVPPPPGVPAEQYRPRPRQPPPGLAVAEPASCSQRLVVAEPAEYSPWEIAVVSHPPVLLTNRDVSLFTHLAAFIDEDGIDSRDHPRFDLDCNICGDYKLEMPRHASMYCPDDEDAYFQVEPFAVVPCGHMFGYHCLSKWVWEEITDSKIPSCPVCRLKLVHAGCGHLVRIQPYNVRAPRRSQLPPTIHEGGTFNDFCEHCEHGIFEECLQELQVALYPVEPAGSYRDPWTDGVVRTDQLRRDMAANMQRLYRENASRMLRW